ncbi:hypothetical protein [Aquabacterium sp. OR-4]|uniref:hypothetical protein n=1 Tax=Aquabacterium sp. OR-4 TaxID=2978127 RepID=UPI0021B3355F|nr:hypothetical protein [Aquabacterium sp. OR-4]MDT7835131.1 hypothetical protein [Aquabacterium sp. OR-4]
MPAKILSIAMPLHRSRSRFACALAGATGLLLMAACQAQMPAPAAVATPPQATPESALMARIRGEIGEARCDSDAQCRTLAVGEKACGGPGQYLAWSGPAARARKLEAWSAELATLQRQRAAASGMMSNCQYLPDPGAACVQQRCVLRAPGAGGPLAN